MRLQMRFLKNISDEIIKINDFSIEFGIKEKLFLSDNENAEIKNLADLLILRAKVNNHLDYLNAQIEAFPYGNPINFFYYSVTGRYLWEKVKIDVEKCLLDYQDSLLKETLLLKNVDLNIKNDIDHIDAERIDMIVVNGLDIINTLEDHSKKLI